MIQAKMNIPSRIVTSFPDTGWVLIVKGCYIPVYKAQVFSYWNNREDQVGGSIEVSLAAWYGVRDEQEILRNLIHRARRIGKREVTLMCSEAGWSSEIEWFNQYKEYF